MQLNMFDEIRNVRYRVDGPLRFKIFRLSASIFSPRTPTTGKDIIVGSYRDLVVLTRSNDKIRNS